MVSPSEVDSFGRTQRWASGRVGVWASGQMKPASAADGRMWSEPVGRRSRFAPGEILAFAAEGRAADEWQEQCRLPRAARHGRSSYFLHTVFLPMGRQKNDWQINQSSSRQCVESTTVLFPCDQSRFDVNFK